MPDLVTIATFNQPVEAHLARGRLESEGIETVVLDEGILGVNPLLANAIGGARPGRSSSRPAPR